MPILVSTLLTVRCNRSLLVSRGRVTRFLNAGFVYAGTSLLLAPELINPYYTTYMVNFRFHGSTQRSSPQFREWFCAAWTKACKYGACAFNSGSTYFTGLFKDPEPPATPVESPARTDAARPKPEGQKP